MIVAQSLDWLGLHRRPPAVGVHLSSRHVTLVALRRRPLRLVGLGREPVTDSAVVGDDVRLIGVVADQLRRLTRALCLPPGTAAVAAIEPAPDELDLVLDEPAHPAHCPARDSSYHRLVETISRAGLQLSRVDPVPVSLGRLALQMEKAPVAAVAVDRWWVAIDGSRLRARRSARHQAGSGLQVGPGPDALRSVSGLAGFGVPRRLQALVDAGSDGAAIGAALAGLGPGPRVSVGLQAPTGDEHWVVEHWVVEHWVVERVDERVDGESQPSGRGHWTQGG
jgi:hypothetical protein